MAAGSLSDRLGTSLVWFALGMIAMGVGGFVAGQKWLNAHIEERLKLSETLDARLAAIELKEGPRGAQGPQGEQGPPGEASAAPSLPKGIIVPSHIACPYLSGGWSDFHAGQGRFIVGAGDAANNPYGNELTSRRAWGPRMANPPQETVGGAETVALTMEQMPTHSHVTTPPINTSFSNNVPFDHSSITPTSFGATKNWSVAVSQETRELGRYPMSKVAGGRSDGTTAPHPNMPPYIALYFCKKE